MFLNISNTLEQPIFLKPHVSLYCGALTTLLCMSELEVMFVRYFVFNKSTNKRITYTKEVGEKLQDLGSAVVNIPPVTGRHADWTILWRPVVQEVGQQLCCPSCAIETLVEGSSKQWICQ